MEASLCDKMAKIGPVLVLIVVLACASALPGKRLRRGFNSGYGDSSGGYGRGSDERDASVSEESGCNSGSGGYSRGGYSGSRELAYNRDGRPSGETRGGRSFTKASASAASSATSYSQNLKANIV